MRAIVGREPEQTKGGRQVADQIVAAEAARLEAEFDTARLKALIDTDGWAKA